MKTGIIILAAGAATRMGKPKMLLPYGEKNLLQHIVQQAQQIPSEGILIVTGYYDAMIKQAFNNYPINLVYNEQWKEGMASSIKLGLQWWLEQNNALTQIMILVSDQPYLNADILNKLLQQQQQTQKGIIAATYDGITGTPVLFSRQYFPQLLQLKGDKGAGNILKSFSEDVAAISFEAGKYDIDTPEDYEQFCLHNN
jgi:molybdenum cofactor cytidylyltransferase